MAKIRIIEYKILKCVAELRADGGMQNLWKTLYTVIIALKEGIFPYLGALNFFFNGIRVREEISGNLGLKKKKAGNYSWLTLAPPI